MQSKVNSAPDDYKFVCLICKLWAPPLYREKLQNIIFIHWSIRRLGCSREPYTACSWLYFSMIRNCSRGPVAIKKRNVSAAVSYARTRPTFSKSISLCRGVETWLTNFVFLWTGSHKINTKYYLDMFVMQKLLPANCNIAGDQTWIKITVGSYGFQFIQY